MIKVLKIEEAVEGSAVAMDSVKCAQSMQPNKELNVLVRMVLPVFIDGSCQYVLSTVESLGSHWTHEPLLCIIILRGLTLCKCKYLPCETRHLYLVPILQESNKS